MKPSRISIGTNTRRWIFEALSLVSHVSGGDVGIEEEEAKTFIKDFKHPKLLIKS